MGRIWIVNVSLFAVLIAAAVRFHNEWTMFTATHQTGAIEPDREKFAKLALNLPPNSPAPANWTDIPSHDPFSFDRTDIAILEPKAPPPPPAPKIPVGPKPVLFGTLSLGKEPMALIGPGKPGNRDYKPMKVGEIIDGWTLVSISDKSVVMKGDDVQETIAMNDPTAQIPRDHTRTEVAPAPVVTSAGGLPPPPATPAVSSPQQPGTRGQQPAQQPGQRRRTTQITPFGTREIEEPEK